MDEEARAAVWRQQQETKRLAIALRESLLKAPQAARDLVHLRWKPLTDYVQEKHLNGRANDQPESDLHN